jgi:beta-1,4-N-acetylglucosaminyltransferase
MVENSSPSEPVTSAAPGRVDVLLVCSTGGHLLQLVALRDAWEGFSRVWVTFDKSDSRSLLADERVTFAHGPTNRNFGLLAVRNLVRNGVLAFRLVRAVRPKVVLTTGAGVAVPFAWLGRLLGARVVYVESLTRIDHPSLSCRLIAPVATRIYAQWPELTRAVPRARYLGSVISGS